MSASEKIFDDDGMIIEWGTRLFWPSNKKVKPSSTKGGGSIASKRPPSRAAVLKKIRATVRQAPQVMVKVTGGGKGMAHIAAHFSYISRNGELELEDENGKALKGREALKELQEDWQTVTSYIKPKETRREAFNIMLSMPHDTDPEMVRDAVRAFAKRELANHQYVFVLHKPESDTKTERPHVHLAVRAEGFDGTRLNPRKQDLQQWREVFAEELQARGIAARSSKRQQHGSFFREQPRRVTYAAQRGEVVEKRSAPITAREVETQKEVLNAWKGLSRTLARSAVERDRQTALDITEMVRRMPTVTVNSPSREVGRTPDRDVPRGR